MKVYKVGGAVRDKLLGLGIKDQDWVVVGSHVDEMIKLGYRPVGKDFPVFLHPESHEEYALARTERKSGKGYKGFEFFADESVTLEDDLIRRDLTINAMAEDEQGNIIDPYGGQSDLKQGLLRHVSPAFVEDPLRVLRVARFAARFGFKIAPETLALMRELSESGELESLVAERVWTELEKALAGKYPARFVLALRACGALKVLFPEIEKLFGIPQPKQYHPEIDTGLHTIMSLNQACRLSDDTEIRFAALVHDLGKGVTPESKWPSHHGHEQAGVKIIEALCERYRVPKSYCQLATQVSRFHLDCHRVSELKASTLVKKLEQMDAFRQKQRFNKFLLVCEADARGRSGKEEDAYPQAAFFLKALESATDIDTASIAREGGKGEEIAQRIHQKRVESVRMMLS